jgi:hypothetical protein
MRKFAATLFAALAFAAAPAQASIEFSTEHCRRMADAAVVVAEFSKLGGTWERVKKIVADNLKEPELHSTILEVYSEAYYSWADFPKSSVRTLAYTKCKTLLSK